MSDGLTNGYLENLGKKLIGETFLGVFPCDLYPVFKNRKKCFLIFNLSKHNELGTHFVSVALINNTFFYFDPLGDKLSNKHIINFLAGKKVCDLKKKIQDDTSNFCGYFSLAFLMSLNNKCKPPTFMRLFENNNLKINDAIVTEFIVSSIPK